MVEGSTCSIPVGFTQRSPSPAPVIFVQAHALQSTAGLLGGAHKTLGLVSLCAGDFELGHKGRFVLLAVCSIKPKTFSLSCRQFNDHSCPVGITVDFLDSVWHGVFKVDPLGFVWSI